MASINPYLTFKDNTEEVFNFYKSVFGGEFQNLTRFSDMPSEHTPASNKIMHVALPIGPNTILMGSDSPEGFGPPLNVGNNMSIAAHTETKAEADKIFNGLSAGGKVTMPMSDAPWGAYFGMFTDKFGIHWMVNCDQKK